jgi:hypothetical protein
VGKKMRVFHTRICISSKSSPLVHAHSMFINQVKDE